MLRALNGRIGGEAEDLIKAIRDAVKENKGGRPRKDIWPCHHCGGEHEVGKNSCHGWIEGEPSQAIAETTKPTQKIVEVSRDKRESAHKTAELFNTNRTYVNQANKLKEQAPEVLAKVQSGELTVNQAAIA